MFSIIKRSNETKTVTIDFTPDIVGGETISSVEATITNVVTGAAVVGVASGEAFSGLEASVQIAGGTLGETYELLLGVTTSSSNYYSEPMYISISDDIKELYTVNELKTSLGLIDTSKDAVLLNLIRAASAYVESYTGRSFFMKTYTDTYYLDDPCNTLMLDKFPVDNITSVLIDGITLDASTGGVINYKIDPNGALTRVDGGRFGIGAVPNVITYTAGFVTAPEDIRNVVKKIATAEYVRREREGILSESMGSYELVFGANFSAIKDPLITSTLNLYRRRNF